MLAWKHSVPIFSPQYFLSVVLSIFTQRKFKKNCFEFELLRVKPCWLVSWCFEPSQPDRSHVSSLFTHEEQKEALPMKSRKRLYQWGAERGFTNEEQKEALPMKACAAFDTFATRQPSLHCHWCRLLGNNYSCVFMTFKHRFLTNRMWNRVKHCWVHILYSIAFETMHDASLFQFPFKFLCHANTDYLPTDHLPTQTTCPQGCFLWGDSRQ